MTKTQLQEIINQVNNAQNLLKGAIENLVTICPQADELKPLCKAVKIIECEGNQLEAWLSNI